MLLDMQANEWSPQVFDEKYMDRLLVGNVGPVGEFACEVAFMVCLFDVMSRCFIE